MLLDFRFCCFVFVQGNNETDAWLHTGLCGRPTSLAFLCFPALCEEYLCKNQWSSYCQDKSWGPCPISCGLDQTYCSSYVYDSEGRKPVPEIASEKSCFYHCCSFMFLVTNWMVGIITVLVVSQLVLAPLLYSSVVRKPQLDSPNA